jgi:cell division protein FtsQ
MSYIKNLSQFIQKDSFWSAQVAQVDITPQRNFEIVPTIGSYIIEMGDGENLERKFNRLMLFYKQVLVKPDLISTQEYWCNTIIRL